MSVQDLIADLTGPQREAVSHTDGPLLVLAGAGSGKTRVITRRAAYLARTVARSDQVLAITFTNKAAGEMRERISSLGVGRGMTVCTFHSLCARVLREFASRVGRKPNFTIYDQDDRLTTLREAIEACDLSAEHWRPRTVEHRISQAKNQMILLEAFREGNRDFSGREIVRIWAKYDEMMTAQNAVDFDDLLVLTARLLGEHPDVRDAFEERWPYLLIDEYQDTNHPQYLIATRLASGRRNICATGDPDQSIYGWRGANIHNILDFEKDYPDAHVVRLEQNYRSTPSILAAASSVIQNNRRRKEKSLWTENPPGEPVRVWRCEDEHDEARRIAEDISRNFAKGGNPGDVAVFYRVTALTRVLEDALRRGRIPYQIARGVEFYARKEIKDVLCYLRLIVNPADDLAFRRAINTPARGIGKTSIERLSDFARAAVCSLSDAMIQAEAIGTLKTAAKKFKAFAELMDGLRRRPARPVQALLEHVLKQSGLQAELDGDPDPEKPALANVNELITAAAEYDKANPDGSLAGWLEEISLVSDVDRLNLAGGAVTLMTLHAAKGLEFGAVYIAGLEDALLPHARAIQGGDGDIEEERRLFFVGMTRAMKRLTITSANYRTVRGLTERTLQSRFVRELPLDEIEWIGQDSSRRDGYQPTSDFEYETFDPADWQPGRRVRHPAYGEGRLMRLEPRGRTLWVRVAFDDFGEKSFALEHAPLTFVNH